MLDLGCGDGVMGPPLLALGLRYRGVDGSEPMLAAARARLGPELPLDQAFLDEYEPPQPVDLTLCLRTVYAFPDRHALFARVAGYTRVKFVFDFDPRAQERAAIAHDLRDAGFEQIVFRPFLLPQRVALPAPVRAGLRVLERTGPLARAALHVRGIWFCAAVPPSA